MKFLTKTEDSEILKKNLIYKEHNTENNKILRNALLAEQKNFCAYTEEYMNERHRESCEIEHFNPFIKGHDDYYNYYAVTRTANLHKRKTERKNIDAKFFKTLFFQKPGEFGKRISYDDGQYIASDPNDQEAKDFINYLDFNHHLLFNERRQYVGRLKKHLEEANYKTKEQIIEYLNKHKDKLSFITAIEHEFGIDLGPIF